MIPLSSRPVSFYALAILASFVGFLRAAFEYQFFGAGFSVHVGWSMPFFYFSIGVVLLVILRFIVQLDWRRCFGAVAIGISLGILPPLIDLGLSGFGSRVVYSYNFIADLQVYPWLFYRADGIPAGECASLWLSVVLTGVYSFLASRNTIRSLAAAAALYLTFHLYLSGIPIATAWMVMGRLPDATTAAGSEGHIVNAVTYFFPFWYAGMSLTGYWALKPYLLRLFLRRVLHILPFTFISLLGAAITNQPETESFLNAACLSLIFYVAAIENDYFDSKFEQSKSPVNRQDIAILRVIAVMIISWLLLLGQMIGFLYLLIYFAAALYHMPDYRARRYFAAGMKIEGVWGWLAFVSGYSIRLPKTLNPEIVVYGFLVFLGWSLISVFKDLKDLRKDKRSGSQSIYLYLRSKGLSISSTHRVLMIFVFVVLLAPSVFYFIRHSLIAAALLALFNVLILVINSRRVLFWKFYLHLGVISCYIGTMVIWFRPLVIH